MKRLCALIIVVAVAIFMNGCGGRSDDRFHGYENVTLEELNDALEGNAAHAKKTYEGMYVRVIGEIRNIDSSGTTCEIGEWVGFLNYESIDCHVKDLAQEYDLQSVREGDIVAASGRITRVDDSGYEMDVASIEMPEPEELPEES